ncbi:hypothetical protein HRG_008373 [Hirsutella rhossiliensis]|uniref:Uncharacterized protein n=1 Tax=Hirsutella rhossiliensis TaxID=111463 RepID=A0A9P8MR09_9HYPO|nr:uncharacterized protein HRG_08373 [Hirsutella rhossiliensis]KAH0960218.1 hypothetical protein HRG_08373 [Hirsutella rhossiliensis]
MERMGFVPGPQAKEQIFNAQGHLFFSRQTALDYAEEFIKKAPDGYTDAHIRTHYQSMKACLGEGDQVDIWFGLRDPNPARGQHQDPSGELVGHTWALVKTADGNERQLWEVGQETPPMGEAHAARAFNAYREAMARHLNMEAPEPVQINKHAAKTPRDVSGRPVISRALAPSNLYYASSRMWYFVDLGLAGGTNTPIILSRPMRSFDALVLSALMTLVLSAPPLVFGISTRKTDRASSTLPAGYLRAKYEADETLQGADDRPVLVL